MSVGIIQNGEEQLMQQRVVFPCRGTFDRVEKWAKRNFIVFDKGKC